MRIKGRIFVVLVLGLGTALAMAVSGQREIAGPDVVGIAKNKSSFSDASSGSQRNQLQSDIHFDLAVIKRTMPSNIQSSGLFQSKSWYVPPSPPSMLSASLLPLPPPPPPSPPQLPFTFIGRMIDGDEVTLFLTNNNRQYIARINDVLDETYRLDQITEKSASFTYLPLNTVQELMFNSTAIGISALSMPASATQPTLQQQILVSQ